MQCKEKERERETNKERLPLLFISLLHPVEKTDDERRYSGQKGRSLAEMERRRERSFSLIFRSTDLLYVFLQAPDGRDRNANIINEADELKTAEKQWPPENGARSTCGAHAKDGKRGAPARKCSVFTDRPEWKQHIIMVSDVRAPFVSSLLSA